MELSKNYIPNEVETKWYQHWLDKQYFNSKVDPNRDAYTIVIPPPNVTGVLHMGHALNNTIQDILIRRARMQGKNACWVPGTDHASIATEAKVVQMLRERGITKSSLTREEFLAYAWEWKEKYGGIILQQLKKLGCSLDWERTSFTMDEDYYNAVIKVFIDLHGKGLIYRGKRMVNWDPESLTALSDEEVIFKEVDSKLYHVVYKAADGSDNSITVATTRPETILGDVAICVNPTDERYIHLIGKEVIVPIINRKIPVIADEYVTADFGTGALKVTPAHDKNDNMLGAKYNLKTIDTLDETGKFTSAEIEATALSEQVLSYNGMDRFVLRKKIAEDIKAIGQLTKIEDYKGQIGTSERTGAVIESRLSLQWFIDMKKFMQKNPEALQSVMEDKIQFHPAKTKNTYSHWLENIKDWCISRQLWWGQRIPAWYDEEGNCVVAVTKDEAVEKFKIQNPKSKIEDIKQDEDVLDTWFSSWLWPMEVFKGISHPGNEDTAYYYPSTTLVTGQDIIFFWVARMIMAGYEYTNKPPFKDVYFTGMVRDKEGRKMSKQLGNSPDLLGLIDQYGADAVRFGIMIASPAGNDLLFDESSLEQGRNFNNKLWNALKLVKLWEERQEEINSEDEHYAVLWFEVKLYNTKRNLAQLFVDFKLSEALKIIYSLIWDDFCSYYLERVKPEQGQPIDSSIYKKTIFFFSELLELLHPYMPFITEEINHLLEDSRNDLCIKLTEPLLQLKYNKDDFELTEICRKLSTKLAEFRIKRNIKKNEKLEIMPIDFSNEDYEKINIRLKKDNAVIGRVKITNAGDLTEEDLQNLTNKATSELILVEEYKFFIDLGTIYKAMEGALVRQQEQQRKQELLKDLAHQKSFLESVLKKLSNERFVQNAKPEVLALEQKKQADAEARIKTIEESLTALN
jgi:valyl-tRNA synthetase